MQAPLTPMLPRGVPPRGPPPAGGVRGPPPQAQPMPGAGLTPLSSGGVRPHPGHPPSQQAPLSAMAPMARGPPGAPPPGHPGAMGPPGRGPMRAGVSPEALAFENNCTQAYSKSDRAAFVKIFMENTKKNIQPSVKIYTMGLALCSIWLDNDGVNAILGDLEKRNLLLDPEQYESLISVLGTSPCKNAGQHAYRVYKLMGTHGLVPRSPKSYSVLSTCTSSPAQVDSLVKGLKENAIKPCPLALLAMLEHAEKSTKDSIVLWLSQKDVDWEQIADRSEATDCANYVKWLGRANGPISPALFQAGLHGCKSGRESASLLVLYMKSGGKPTANNFETAMRDVAATRDAEGAIEVWNSVVAHSITPPESLLQTILRLLSEQNDSRIIPLFKQAPTGAAKNPTLLNYVLKVIANGMCAAEAKSMWKRMQVAEAVPDEETVTYLLRACLKDSTTLHQIATVVRASDLTLSQEATHICTLSDQIQAALNPPPPQQQWSQGTSAYDPQAFTQSYAQG